MTEVDVVTSQVERVRESVVGREVREVRMFGVRAFMVDGSLAVAVQPDGGLLVHVAADEDAALLTEPGASRALMGPGRSMGVGWIRVEADAVRSDAGLAAWLAAADRRTAA